MVLVVTLSGLYLCGAVLETVIQGVLLRLAAPMLLRRGRRGLPGGLTGPAARLYARLPEDIVEGLSSPLRPGNEAALRYLVRRISDADERRWARSTLNGASGVALLSTAAIVACVTIIAGNIFNAIAIPREVLEEAEVFRAAVGRSKVADVPEARALFEEIEALGGRGVLRRGLVGIDAQAKFLEDLAAQVRALAKQGEVAAIGPFVFGESQPSDAEAATQFQSASETFSRALDVTRQKLDAERSKRVWTMLLGLASVAVSLLIYVGFFAEITRVAVSLLITVASLENVPPNVAVEEAPSK
jgi:hypothetical protein